VTISICSPVSVPPVGAASDPASGLKTRRTLRMNSSDWNHERNLPDRKTGDLRRK